MKKLIPLLIVLAFISGGLYYQNELIDLFMGPSQTDSSSDSKQSAPPSLPAFDFGPPAETPTEEVLESPPETANIVDVQEQPILDEDSNAIESQDELDLSSLDDLDVESSESSDTTEENSDIVAPPSMPAFNFGPPAETSPIDPVSDEVAVEVTKIKTPDLSPQEFKNSFLKFNYPINITAQNVSLSSLDLNSIEDKLLNLSFFNNPNRLSIQDFVADSSNVTDFFANLVPERLEIDSVDEAFVVLDVALATKFYVIKSENIIVLIEMDIDRNFEFIEQIIIPSIESQIL